MRRNQSEPQDATRAKLAREIVFILSIGRKLHDTIVSGQLLKSLYWSGVSFNFVRQDVISRLWFSEKLKVIHFQSSDWYVFLRNIGAKSPFGVILFWTNVILISGDKTDSVFHRFHRTTRSKEHLSNQQSREYALHCAKQGNWPHLQQQGHSC